VLKKVETRALVKKTSLEIKGTLPITLVETLNLTSQHSFLEGSKLHPAYQPVELISVSELTGVPLT
jgi:hypothetical protein